MARFTDKVVFVTGGARGQGRSHAVAFADEGADVVLFDIPDALPTISYPPATLDELKETQSLVAARGRRCLAIEGDVRSFDSMQSAVNQAIEELGHVDIMLANAGVASYHTFDVMTPEIWHELIDINLNGVFNSIRPVLPHMLERGWGRIIVTSSTAGRQGTPNALHYSASKWAVIGLIKSIALETATSGVTVNAVAPTAVNTPLIFNDETFARFRPDLDKPTWEDVKAAFTSLVPVGVPYIEAVDVSKAMLYLASDDARYVTGAVMDVTGGKAGRWTA